MVHWSLGTFSSLLLNLSLVTSIGGFLQKVFDIEQGVVAHAQSLHLEDKQVVLCELKASLVYTVSSNQVERRIETLTQK